MTEGALIKSRIVERFIGGLAGLVPVGRLRMSKTSALSGEIQRQGPIGILVPHPDDEIIGCFHFLQKLGPHVPIDLIYVSEDRAAMIAEARRAESAEATKTLTLRERVWWRYPDGDLDKHRDDLRRRLLDIGTRYGLILCPAPSDRTPDHAILAKEACAVIPPDRLLWYRSTWLTFPLHTADFVAEGDADAKRSALNSFDSQRKLALQNVVTLSGFEGRSCGMGAESVEAFRFASSGEISVLPVNVLSVKALLQLRLW